MRLRDRGPNLPEEVAMVPTADSQLKTPAAEPRREAAEARAKAAGLRYVTDADRGIRRERRGRGFAYRSEATGRVLRSRSIIDRIERLAIPPAYTEVWICRDARGHLQATGRDERGRKQYRYHADWSEHAGVVKWDGLAAFGASLNRLRPRLRRMLDDRDGGAVTREAVLAAVITLLDRGRIRVGNEAYAEANNSYGASTLRRRHTEVKGETVVIDFVGKSGNEVHAELCSELLAGVVRACQELPGQRLFCYRDAGGALRTVDSGEINDWLGGAIGPACSAKSFRTWHATVAAAGSLDAAGAPKPGLSAHALNRRFVAACRVAAGALVNTPAVARKHYVAPCLAERDADGRLHEAFSAERASPRGLSELTLAERAVVRLLEAEG